MKPRLLLADDHTLVLEGFRKLLETEFQLIGAVEDGRSLLEAAERLKPDVILLDISMPVLNGFEAARHLRQTVPGAKLVFVTMHSDPDYVNEAFRVGASGYLLKRSAASEMVTAIEEVLKGRRYLTPLISPPQESLHKQGNSLRPFPSLTARQREVLQLVAEGRSNKDMAKVMGVSVKTVEFHKASIKTALGIRTIAELTRYAMQHGMSGA